ncbi:MAG: DUF695 domain-containing protein [Muribaculaceae bacterium]|nr:DUF695 domain-containing protein [Muribaculaceae bacterium]
MKKDEIDFGGEWWTTPAEDEAGNLLMVTGREDIEKFRNNVRFSIRVEIAWKYGGEGMPSETDGTADLIEQADTGLRTVFHKDPVAVLTGVFTGGGERTWVFYTLSTHIFQKKINEALAALPLLPLEISAENDPDWEAYAEMEELKGMVN